MRREQATVEDVSSSTARTDYTVGAVAELAAVSVRTLHHYDQIGLLRPSDRSEAGYRLYTRSDLDRLQEILFFRELGFALADISEMLSRPAYNRGAALLRQRQLLQEKHHRMVAMIEAIEAAIAAHEEGNTMSTEDMFAVFGDFDPKEYEGEAEQRWGETDAWKESTRRTSGYSKEDWQAIKDEGDEIARSFAAILADGHPADSAPAMDTAERHRLHIERWFYPCSREMHANLGSMYTADPRFTETWERYGQGVAEFVSDAIVANAVRAESRPTAPGRTDSLLAATVSFRCRSGVFNGWDEN